ncbi:MAG TPA: endonuclease domain-containing protein [Actinocrinis sp.]|nr:endonuclease domain-containing protein [Actinocrinis sp.]
MADEPQHRPVRESLVRRIPLTALAEFWAGLGAPDLVAVPDAGLMANIARAGLPILLGRTLIRAEKISGRWQVSKDDLQAAARDLTALASIDAAGAGPRQMVTIRTTDELWAGKLARMLRDNHPNPESGREPVVWTGPWWKKHWYWDCQWGCLDFAKIAEPAAGAVNGDAWVIPQLYAEFAADAAAQVERFSADRRRCSRCGETAARRRGWADVDTSGGWESLCANCLASHDSQLRDYQGQLRDIPYARARYRRENPPTWYRCVLCGLPAVVWDHCHEHGYIRGPLCRTCNTNDNWLFRAPYRNAEHPIDHVEQCKGCAGAGPGIGVVAVALQYWIGTLAAAPEEHEHPEGVRLSAFPGRLAIQSAVKDHSFAVEPIAWKCKDCEEHWERSIDPDQMLTVSSQVLVYLRTGDLSRLVVA